MSDRFTIATETYEGPLEALLNLIEDRKMPISDISLSEVADSYLAYVEKLPELPLGETAQFILVASTLLLIKSRALLPIFELSQDERESVEELERRLARYAIVRKIAKLLRKEWCAHPLLLAHRAPARPSVFSPAEASLVRIAEVARRLVSILPKPGDVVRATVAPLLRLEDVIVSLKKRLTGALKTRFSDLTKSSEKAEVIVYFLAMLELVRTGSASVTQDKLFAEITLEAEGIAGMPQYGV